MRALIGICVAVFAAWYAGVGYITSEYMQRRLLDACPGHVRAVDRWPVLVTGLGMVTWPLDPIMLLVPKRHLVCDRFDP